MQRNTLKIKWILRIMLLLLIASCADETPLPILGEKEMVDGVEVNHKIPDFSFLNQDSVIVTNDDLNSSIYVADFFFTHCPSICPLVTKEMLRIHDAFIKDNVKLVSFTMDPKRDTPAQLKNYSSKLEVEAPKWQFLTGEKSKLHDLATDFFSVVIEDDDAPGGFNHTGKLLLIDQNRQIRAFCEGTDSDDVDDFILDIKKLLAEYEK